MGFSQQEHWSGLTCPPLGDLPDSEMEHLLADGLLHWQADSLPLSHQGSHSNRIEPQFPKMITCSLTYHLLGFLPFCLSSPSPTCTSLNHIPRKCLNSRLFLKTYVWANKLSGLTYLYPFYLTCLLVGQECHGRHLHLC